jgi:hypothetical protein
MLVFRDADAELVFLEFFRALSCRIVNCVVQVRQS